MGRLTPLLGQLATKVGLDTTRQAAAVRSWLVEPASETVHRPALFDPEDLRKVTGVAPDSTAKYQMDRLTRARTRHPPVHLHALRDVTLAAGGLFRWNLVDLIGDGGAPRLARADPPVIDHAVMASTFLGNRFFGHWLLDDMPLALLAAGHGERVGHVGRDNVPTSHQHDYLARFAEPVRHVREAFFRELLVFDYVTENVGKRSRYATMRTRLLPSSGVPAPTRGVMLLRGASGQPRVLVNEAEVAARVASRGFTVLDPVTARVEDIVAACHDAPVLLGTEGSHLAHGFLPMRPGGTVFVLQPPFKLDHFWRDRTNCTGGRYAFVVGDAVPGGFRVEPDAVEAMLDRIDA